MTMNDDIYARAMLVLALYENVKTRKRKFLISGAVYCSQECIGMTW